MYGVRRAYSRIDNNGGLPLARSHSYVLFISQKAQASVTPVQVGDQRFGAVNVSDSFRFFGCTDCRQDRGVADVAGFDADAVFELSDEVVVISAFQRPYATVDANQRGAEGTASASRLCRAAATCVVCLDAACPLPCFRGILPCLLCRFVAVLFTAECSGRNLVPDKIIQAEAKFSPSGLLS